MARKYPTTNRRAAAQDGRTFPSVVYERVRDPIGRVAIEQPGVARTLLRRGIRALRWTGIGAILLVPSIAAAVIWPNMPGGAGFGVFVGVTIGTIMIVYSVFRVIGAVRLWVTMRRHPWRVFSCQVPSSRVEGPLILVLTHKDQKYRVRTRGTERTLAIWRMQRPEVWFVGDPEGRGVLTPAGGPELFITHRAGPAKVANRARAAAKPKRPSRYRQLFPKRPPSAAALQRQAARAARRKAADQARRLKLAEQARVRQAKAAERARARQAWAADHPSKKPAKTPTKTPTKVPTKRQTPKPPKQPGLATRLRKGRSVNWMK